MRQHVRRVLTEVGALTLPVRLTELFVWAGVRKVRSESMLIEGALKRTPAGLFDILVREDRPSSRKRFSVAHELGHIFFYRFAPAAKAMQERLGRQAPHEEERLCNIAAEELLMPAWFLEELLREPSASPADRVLKLAEHCDVSVEAAMIRLAPLWRGAGELQLWQRQEGLGWQRKLACKLGRYSESLDGFKVEAWDDKFVAEMSSLPWVASSWLYSVPARRRLPAQTTALRVPGRQTTVIVSHELTRQSPASSQSDIDRARLVRVRRAIAARAQPDCQICRGTGWIEVSHREINAATRLEPAKVCECRYNQESAHAESA
jgi:hypothetical protein